MPLGSRRFAAPCVKETLQILRDPSTGLIAFVLPLFLLFLFGYAVNLDTARTRIGLSVRDNSEAAASLARDFDLSRWFDVVKTGSLTELGRVAGQRRDSRHRRHSRRISGATSRRGRRHPGYHRRLAAQHRRIFVAGYAEGVRATWAAST